MAVFTMDEDGELELKGGETTPKVEELMNASREFERRLIVRYIEAVANGQSNSLVQRGLKVVLKEIEKGSHMDFYADHVSPSPEDDQPEVQPEENVGVGPKGS